MCRLAAGLMLLVCCLTTSCTPAVGDGGQEALPHDTMTDWATYGDLLATVTVTGASREPLTAEERERGEGLEVRTVTLSLGQPSWVRSGAPHTPPASLTMANGGWMIHTTAGVRTERRIQMRGQTVADVGQEYLALLSYTDITAIVDPDTRVVTPGEGPAWAVLDLVPLTNGTAATPEGRQTQARQAVAGNTAQQAGDVLQETAPDPAAAKYMDLDPVVRYQYTQFDHQSPSPLPARATYR